MTTIIDLHHLFLFLLDIKTMAQNCCLCVFSPWPLLFLWKIEDDDKHSCLRLLFLFLLLLNTKMTTQSYYLCVFFVFLKGRIVPFYAYGHLRKVENSINSLSVCFHMCYCSFVNVGPFKRLVFVLLDFGRICFVFFWLSI